MQLSVTVFDSPDARALADFYRRLLGRAVGFEDDDWVMLEAPDGGAALAFQTEPRYVRPVWPPVLPLRPLNGHHSWKIANVIR